MSSREIDDGLNLSLQLKCPSQKSPQHKPSVNGIVFQSSSASRPNTVLDMNGIGRRTEREETRSEQHSASSEGADGSDDSAARKKLRLTKEQTELLEETFNLQNTLTQNQKVVLAKQLDLQTRQVEVWFQNRRARTKLKKTEVDCAYLKRVYQKLAEENQRLIKELADFKAIKFSYLATTVTSLNMCPQCERMSSPPSATGTSNQLHISEFGPQDQKMPKDGDWLLRKFHGE